MLGNVPLRILLYDWTVSPFFSWHNLWINQPSAVLNSLMKWLIELYSFAISYITACAFLFKPPDCVHYNLLAVCYSPLYLHLLFVPCLIHLCCQPTILFQACWTTVHVDLLLQQPKVYAPLQSRSIFPYSMTAPLHASNHTTYLLSISAGTTLLITPVWQTTCRYSETDRAGMINLEGLNLWV